MKSLSTVSRLLFCTSILHAESAAPTDHDLQPPSPKRQHASDIPNIEHHLVDLIKWRDENGVTRELKIYSKIAHRWNQIATRLGFELGEIDSIRRNYPFDDRDRVTAVLGRWLDDARNLPNASSYPKSWQGLLKLLQDAELSEVAGELHTALNSTHNNVRGNLS